MILCRVGIVGRGADAAATEVVRGGGGTAGLLNAGWGGREAAFCITAS